MILFEKKIYFSFNSNLVKETTDIFSSLSTYFTVYITALAIAINGYYNFRL